MPDGTVQFDDSSASLPPKSATTSLVCGTSGTPLNVTVLFWRFTVPVKVITLGGGKRIVNVGESADAPVK